MSNIADKPDVVLPSPHLLTARTLPVVGSGPPGSAHRIEPIAPDRTRVECTWYVPQDATEVAYAVEFWDITNREDWAACESVQRGLSSPHYRAGPLAPNEDAVYHWMSFLARAYQDPVAAFAAAVE